MSGPRRHHLAFLSGALVGGLALALVIITSRAARGEPVLVVQRIPDPTSPDSVATVHDSLVFDLRDWPDLDERGMTRARMRNHLKMHKVLDAQHLVMHFSTSGAEIRLACPNRRCRSYRQLIPTHPGEESYALVVDISDVVAGQEFDLEVVGTYVDGFRDPDAESASTYTGSHVGTLRGLSLTVLAPDAMPFQQVRADSDPAGRASAGGLTIAADRKRVHWRIADHSPATHYILYWSW